VARIKGILDELKRLTRPEEASAAIQNAYSGLKEQVSGYTGDKLAATVREFDRALPFIERAGYNVTEIEVVLTAPPSILPHLEIAREITAEQRAELLEETRDMATANRILRLLFRASDMHRTFRFRGFSFAELEITVGIIPAVNLIFRRKGLRRLVSLPARDEQAS